MYYEIQKNRIMTVALKCSQTGKNITNMGKAMYNEINNKYLIFAVQNKSIGTNTMKVNIDKMHKQSKYLCG